MDSSGKNRTAVVRVRRKRKARHGAKVGVIATSLSKHKYCTLQNVFLVGVWTTIFISIILSEIFISSFHSTHVTDKEEWEQARRRHHSSSKKMQTPYLGELNCVEHGGPDNLLAEEMVYWQAIPRDLEHTSPFYQENERERFLTFEPYHGSFNNMRLSFETALALAYATGRTLVLPPKHAIPLLSPGEHKQVGISDFFAMKSLHAKQHKGRKVITMKEFLNRQLHMKKPLLHIPHNRTNWNGQSVHKLYTMLRNQAQVPDWNPDNCIAYFPKNPDAKPEKLQHMFQTQVLDKNPSWEDYVDKPTPLHAAPHYRLAEMTAGRERLCLYGPKLQEAPLIHFPTRELHQRDDGDGTRNHLLVPFYAFLFFQDIHQDLWLKRFIRDHLRYNPEITCAAARVVASLRNMARNTTGGGNGTFQTMHVRRGDFQEIYIKTRVSGEDIYDATVDVFQPGDVVYIATDEKDRSFFNPLMKHYKVFFLDDFIKSGVLAGAHGRDMNPEFYGMIDQLVASRGQNFFGCFLSTFTSYINRLRGYHSQLEEREGYRDGKDTSSYFYAPDDHRFQMHYYHPIKERFFAREFPTSWRMVDRDVPDVKHTDVQ